MLLLEKQLELLDDHLSELLKAKVPDSQAVERTSRASAALSELEQKLDSRPNLAPVKVQEMRPSHREFEPL